MPGSGREGSPRGAAPGPARPGGLAAARLTAIFAKQPVPGSVKTRLVPPLSAEDAARLAEAMLADTVAKLSAAEAFRTALLFAPARAEGWFRARFPEIADQRPQRGTGLAQRLARFFADALADAATASVVAVGSDQPLVPVSRIEAAHEILERGADLVLGPDRGGGYYMVGLRRPHPELFTRVEMSTAGMLAETVRIARAAGLSLELLEEDLDVDLAADLERLRAELARLSGSGAASDYPRSTAALLAELEVTR